MTLVFALLVTLGVPLPMSDPTPPAVPRVPEGRWGGVGLSIEVTSSGAKMELDCAHGTIDSPLILDDQGNFDLPGTLVLEHGGPVRQGEPERKEAVRVTGRLDGQTLRVRVVRPDAPKQRDSISVALGKPPILRKCS